MAAEHHQPHRPQQQHHHHHHHGGGGSSASIAPDQELHQFALHSPYTQSISQQQEQLQFQFEQLQQQQQFHGRYALDVIPPATTLIDVHHDSSTAYEMLDKQEQQQQQQQQQDSFLAPDALASAVLSPPAVQTLSPTHGVSEAGSILLPDSGEAADGGEGLELAADEAVAGALVAPSTPQLYKTSKMRRPELWQFIRLVVPDPPQIAVGKTYTNQDAKEAYCLKCKRMMHYNTGSSNNVSRHMAKFHPTELASFELKLSERKRKEGGAPGPHKPGAHGRKRKLQPTAAGGSDSARRPLPGHARDDGTEPRSDDDEHSAAESDESRKHPRVETGSVSPSSSSNAGSLEDHTLLHPYPHLSTAGPSGGASAAAMISSVVETEKLNTLIAKWVCKHYHPFGITEDPEFQEIINFAINMKKGTTLPPQSEVRASVESLSARTRLDLLHQLASEAHFFSLATEFWTTTERDVFVSFSIHYLTQSFELRHFTLDVREYNGHLSPEERKEQVDMILSRWNLDPRCMNLILWDSYNPPPLENEFLPLHTAQTESVAHVLQCIVAPILHAQKELSMDDVPLFFVDEQVNSLVARVPPECERGVSYLRAHVAAFRDLAWFLTNHPRAVVWMSKFTAGSAQVRLVVDAKSNWLSTVDMLRRLLRKREVIRDFFAYIETSEGRVEFQHSGICSRAAPGSEQWGAVECLLQLLQPFESVAVAICKDKYTSSCLTLALLRFLQRDLEKAPDLQRALAHVSASTGTSTSDAAAAKRAITASVEAARRFLHGRFVAHFAHFSAEYLWISQLDPRFVRMKYLDEREREACKGRLVERGVALSNFLQSQKEKLQAAGGAAAHPHAHYHHLHHLHESATSSSAFLDFQSSKDDHDTNIFLRELLFDDAQDDAVLSGHHHHHHHLHELPDMLHGGGGPHSSGGGGGDGAASPLDEPFEQQQELLRQRIVAEVELYYQSAAAARVQAVRDPLHWWRDHARRLPLLAPLARKWLAAVGSVRPTETLEIPHTGMAASLSLGGSAGAAAASHHHHHAGGGGHHYVAVHCDPELVRDMVFVHDNC
ncbi:hypothetical protein PybrP1_000118 [[Pythium] brassicae (nom. inval.)]|nr:hypothetical protein PybrP1_000118 [[Pythium] brassicae (nom. inval.)]